MTAAPTDRELVDALRERHPGEVTALSRRPYRYATSAPLEELRIRIAGDPEIALILKDLARDRLLGDARQSKPAFLHEPSRELETYRAILAPAGIGPRLMAAVADPDTGRHWLLIEKVDGVELWQVGEFEVWERVATWLGELHGSFAARTDELRAANPHLLDLSEPWFAGWRDRAGAALAGSDDGRAAGLLRALGRYDEVIGPLTALERTFVHGELYPSNVLIERGGDSVRVCPVDWEMAGIGPGLIDLAALSGGWDEGRRAAVARRLCPGPRRRAAGRPGRAHRPRPRPLSPASRAPVAGLVERLAPAARARPRLARRGG